MRVITQPNPLLNLSPLSKELKFEINNKKLPLLDSTASLSFVTTDGTVYVVETEQDIQKIAEEHLSGDWKIFTINQSQDEETSLIPVNQNNLSLTQKDVIIDILKIALPITGVIGITVTTNYVTSIFLGNYNLQLLASMTIIEALESPLSNIFQYTLYPTAPLIGRYKKDSPKTVGKIMQQGYLIGLSSSIPSLLIRYFSKPILLALKQNPLLVGHAQAYFHASMWGFPATILVTADEQLLLASDKKLLYVIMSFSDLAVTLGLGYVLMYGKLGFPEMGIASLGYASAARSWLAFIIYKLYFILHKDFKPYKLFNLSLHNFFSELSTYLKIALPVTLQITSKSSFMFIVNMMIGSRYGLSSLVALQVVTRYVPIASLPVQALALATSIQVGTKLGLRNYSSISRYGNTGVLLGLCHVSLLLAICASMPTILASPFLNVDDPNNVKTIELLRPFFIILLVGQMLEAIDTTSVAALRGLMDTALPMLIGIISTWLVAFPLIYVMVNHFGASATMTAMISGLALSSIIDWGLWHIQSSQTVLEESFNPETTEVTKEDDSNLSRCIRFFNPQGYQTVSKIESRVQEVDDDEVVQLDEREELEISEEENKRCECTLF